MTRGGAETWCVALQFILVVRINVVLVVVVVVATEGETKDRSLASWAAIEANRNADAGETMYPSSHLCLYLYVCLLHFLFSFFCSFFFLPLSSTSSSVLVAFVHKSLPPRFCFSVLCGHHQLFQVLFIPFFINTWRKRGHSLSPPSLSCDIFLSPGFSMIEWGQWPLAEGKER